MKLLSPKFGGLVFRLSSFRILSHDPGSHLGWLVENLAKKSLKNLPLRLLSQFGPNYDRMVSSPEKSFCHHEASVRCRLSSLSVTFHIFVFSETTGPNGTKLGRRHLCKVLYKISSFHPNQTTNMAATGNSCF